MTGLEKLFHDILMTNSESIFRRKTEGWRKRKPYHDKLLLVKSATCTASKKSIECEWIQNLV